MLDEVIIELDDVIMVLDAVESIIMLDELVIIEEVEVIIVNELMPISLVMVLDDEVIMLDEPVIMVPVEGIIDDESRSRMTPLCGARSVGRASASAAEFAVTDFNVPSVLTYWYVAANDAAGTRSVNTTALADRNFFIMIR